MIIIAVYSLIVGASGSEYISQFIITQKKSRNSADILLTIFCTISAAFLQISHFFVTKNSAEILWKNT